MDVDEARARFAAGQITEAVMAPSERDNAWHLLFRDERGELQALTDHQGHARTFRDLDAAAEVAHRIGFRLVNVEERF
jgi:hypothetical protein